MAVLPPFRASARDLFINGEEAAGPLREHLELVPVRPAHRAEDQLDVLKRHLVVKQVAHGIHEDALRLLPSQWQIQRIRVGGESEAVFVLALAHRF